jgi:AraC-like DNA-binding protein
MQYITRWRMQVALNALQEEGATVGELANQLGYRSEAAFARAFKRVIGISPGVIRRSAERPDTLLRDRPGALAPARTHTRDVIDADPV